MAITSTENKKKKLENVTSTEESNVVRSTIFSIVDLIENDNAEQIVR